MPDCELDAYPVVFKPAQPHTAFPQHLKVRSLSAKLSFEVKQGEGVHTFNLKPGTYQFEITDPSTSYCSTIQQLTVRGSSLDPTPKAICNNLSVHLPAGGRFITPKELAGRSHSPCGPLEMSLSQDFFSSADVGTKRIKVTVEDAQHRRRHCYSTVKVLPSPKQLQTYREAGKLGPSFEICGASPNLFKAYQQEDGSFRMLAGGGHAKAEPTMLSQARLGDGDMVVELGTIEGTAEQKGSAGLMIRAGCQANAPYVAILMEASTRTLYKEFRLVAGGEIFREWEYRLHAPSWLKIKRKGRQFKAFTSHNGQHWQMAYSISLQLEAVLYWGMTVVHPFSSGRTAATFKGLTIQTDVNEDYPPLPPIALDPFASTPPAGAKTTKPDTYHKSKSTTIMEQEQWSIFPNPAQDYLEVTLPIWKDDHATLHLLNSAGKTILEEKLDVLNGQSHWMNLATVAGGIYYLKLQTVEGQHLTQKVIIDK